MARSSKQSSKEKYERQKELTRERVRRYRQRMSEEKKEEKKKYDRDRHARLKKENKVKGIADLSEREQRRKRKYWRERNRVRAEKKRMLVEVTDSPPASPSGSVREESAQKKRGRKQVRRDKAKAYRTIMKQKDEIKKLERKVAKYKKRLQREKEKKQLEASPSPRKTVKKILGREKVSPNVRKQLFLGVTLQKQISNQIKEIGNKKKEKQVLHKVIGNKIIKKYRLQKQFNKIIPYQANKKIRESGDSFSYTPQTKKSIRKDLSEKLQNFFEDDRVSKMCPGKKDFIKKGGVKKQRRILLSTLGQLHKQFEKEHGVKISKASFCRSRPFWVTFPKFADRQTCACIKHANIELLVTSLRNHNIIGQRTPREVLKNIVCNTEDEACMLGTCLRCKNKEIEYHYEEDFLVKYHKWKKVTEVKVIKNKKREIKKTMKCQEVAKVSKLKSYLKKEMDVFKKHVYYAKHQADILNEKLKSLTEGEILFRLDFSENYVAKYREEVQAVHFGASKRQISLNTGVWYAKVDGKLKTTCFASASDNLDHQAHAVWCHMEPILTSASTLLPDTTAVHIVTDSPSNQYRNRINIYLFKQLLPKYFPKAEYCSWNYTEAGHGKGPMDGVGGTLKREADRKVLRGADICSAKDFVSALKDFNIDLYEIPASVITDYKAEVGSLNIPEIKGIMKVHQITWRIGDKMYARSLSCFACDPSDMCVHYNVGEVFPQDSQKKQERKKKKLNVDEVYGVSSEDESDLEEADAAVEDTSDTHMMDENTTDISKQIVSGANVLVEFPIGTGKKSITKKFVGICQNDPVQEEVIIMFLKPCSNDNRLFFTDENDVSSVPLHQIKAVLPPPPVVMKGNRVYFKFPKCFAN